jgi:uncharacterized membrane protein YbhN (UPF0104 family)
VTEHVPGLAVTAPTDERTSSAGTPPRSVTAVLVSWARRLIIVAVVVIAALQIFREREEVAAALEQLSWPGLLVSVLAVTVGVLLSPLVWRSMLAALGSCVQVTDASKIYLVGQLGKYVPGSVMAFVLQMELGRAAGITRARGFLASILTAGVVVVASLLAGILAVPAFFRNEPQLLWLFVLLPVGLALLHPASLTFVSDRLLKLLRRDPLPQRLEGKPIAAAVGFSLLTYAVYGVHLFVLAGSLQPGARSPLVLILCIGTMGLAMTAGLVAFMLPSGIGARELVIVGGLSAVLPYGQALALTVVSRVMFTVVELVSAGVATLVVKLSAGEGRKASFRSAEVGGHPVEDGGPGRGDSGAGRNEGRGTLGESEGIGRGGQVG